ncbi:hypothetical protein Cgig2_028034 [Carnegiea gigantea]|uniref:Uncharacterized protein n=1 Tax=Carnegiea gigantea TaxID=171969 RepID=A0A9Q1GZ35_9CARY|nr:hypothetical protein Cgig2_028034 [Carnegiea gigantea]
MQAASSARPLRALDYPLVHEREPFQQPEGIPSPCPMERVREVSRSDRSRRRHTGQLRRRAAMEPTGRPAQEQLLDQQLLLPPTQHTPSELLGLRNRNRLLSHEERTLKRAASVHRRAGTLLDGAHNGIWGKGCPVIRLFPKRPPSCRDEDHQCDYFLKKLAHLGRDLVPLVNPILGFGGQEVNPTRISAFQCTLMTRPSLRALRSTFWSLMCPQPIM